MNDLISIVVPVYNVELFLGTCLDSLIKQTYPNVEIIAVDDGATDRSGEICDEYAGKSQKIKVIHTKNRGLSAARNEGMRHAKGKYIGFVDSDDWVEPDMFEILHSILVKENADFSVCGMHDEYHEVSNLQRNNVYDCQVAEKDEIFKLILDDKGFYGYACNKLFVKEKLNNLKFDEKLLSCEDIDFVVKSALHCIKTAYTSERLYHYRHHGQSMTGDMKYNVRKLSILDAYEQICPIYAENCKTYLYKIHCNYLKIAINIKGRMELSKVEDKDVDRRLKNIIQQYYPLVMKDKNVKVSTKINIFLSVHFSSQLLWIKQKILQRKFRSN